jgi:hypothetical protein
MAQCVPKKSESYSAGQEVINSDQFHPVFCLISLLMFGSEQTFVCQYMFYTYKESDHTSQRTQSVSIRKTGRRIQFRETIDIYCGSNMKHMYIFSVLINELQLCNLLAG